ncbi:MAG: DUF4124 domain-containing protein [Gammaproteobacteria bacterium]|jgi:hypothetical protein|nr:DUF4124 domain-containing protein [Gammaproteobacteria bacterium]MDH5241267.1 DUF4124 domain-containing protein [Gammaproteobacteria bacterium]MDH5262605.1 DUF4124 domain-containing protein [Gammaproteobacteria bacterium]MDH5584041.1 DUF4124 domain-containing protein [Gammaproteobacteria bacterium]
MQKRPIFVLLGMLAATAVFAEAYTWTDENGIVHYSDRPQPGAKVIDLGTSSAARPKPAARSATSPSQDTRDDAEPATGYSSIEIASPAAEETLWNIEGTLNVSIALSPPLRPGHQVRLYFDGTPQMVSGTSARLEEVWRGVHNLQVEVIDETGKLVIRSRPSRFYVQQNTIR